VDGPYCAVRFPATNGSNSSGKDPKDEEGGIMNENTRLLRKDDLQAVRSGAMPRLPDCFQTKPKKVVSTEPASVLALTVDGQGVHCVVRWGQFFYTVILRVFLNICSSSSYSRIIRIHGTTKYLHM
jgi:hypothetical protein